MKRRNYGIDLLRITATYMIVILHILGQGGILSSYTPSSQDYNIVWILEIICYCSVNCYALITGYVSINSNFKYKKIINLWLGVFFWSVSLTILLNYLYPDTIGKRDIVKAMFPIIFGEYWYFSCYFALFFFIPFINKFIKNIDKNTFKKLIITISVLMTAINLVSDPFKINDGYSFVWLLSLYFIGAYISKYNPMKNIKNYTILISIVICVLLSFVSKVLIVKNPNIALEFFDENILINYTSFTITAIAIGLIELFQRLKNPNKYLTRFIKKVSPATFGVYIIHVQKWSWIILMKDRFKFLINYHSVILIISILFIAAIFFLFLTYLEMLRLWCFKKMNIFQISDCLIVYIKKAVEQIKRYNNKYLIDR